MAQELTTTTAEKPAPEGGDRDSGELHRQAMADYDTAWAREADNIREGYEDLRFLAGEQWDPKVKEARELAARPCLTINRLPQFKRQITGDIRQMKPSVKVVPVDDRGDPKTAEVLAGMVRYIENRSSAKAVYFQGADGMVDAGRGAWRIETEYASETTFDQELRISPIEDGLAVLFDPDAILPCKVDAQFAFVGVDMSLAAYKKKYPGKAVTGITNDESSSFQGWAGDDYVRVAEYWYKKPVKRLLLVGNGKVMDLTDAPDDQVAAAEFMVGEAARQGIELRLEERDGFKVCRAVINGWEVLEEPKDWPGTYIPIIPCEGEEIRIGRKIIRHGAIRNARDPQRMYNYYASAQTETVALQPKSPFIGTERNFEEFEAEWEAANAENRPFLRYTPDPSNGNAAPQRVAPAVSSQGISEGLAIAAADLQATTGIYNASLGAQSNETSGVAIKRRQTEGDTGTYVYIEHFGQAIEHTGRVILDLIRHVYDTTRTMRIVGADGDEDLVDINQPDGVQVEGQAGQTRNDVTVAAYDVVVEMGPSFQTRREEAREGMVAFLQAAPNAAPLVLDLFAKMQDWGPIADQIRERLETMLPPNLQAKLAEDRGEQPPPPPPELQAQMAAQEAAKELGHLEHDAKVIQAKASIVKAQNDLRRVQLEGQNLERSAQKTAVEAMAAEMAPKPEAAPAAPAQPATDPRVEELLAAVQQIVPVVQELQEVVAGIVDGLTGPQSGPPAAEPPPPGAPVPAQPSQAPAGAFSMPEGMPQ